MWYHNMGHKTQVVVIYSLAFMLMLLSKQLSVYEIRTSLGVAPQAASMIGAVSTLAAIAIMIGVKPR